MPLRLDGFQLDHGTESERILRRRFPEVCDEIRGLADALGVDYYKIASWFLCMGCCMYNLDDNVPELRGCTAFAVREDGRVFYGRNNDLPPKMKDGCTSDLYFPDVGHPFILTSSSFINGEEAINGAGLAVAMTFVMTNPEEIRPGFNSPFIVRYLAEKCRDTSEALSLLSELPIASCCCILLADRSGNIAAAEIAPSERRLITPRCHGEAQAVCIVNSFESREMLRHDFSCGSNYRADERRETVYSAFDDGRFTGRCDFREASQKDKKSEAAHGDGANESRTDAPCPQGRTEAVIAALRGDYGFMCGYDDGEFQTVWSTALELGGTLLRADDDPRKCEFKEDPRYGRISGVGR